MKGIKALLLSIPSESQRCFVSRQLLRFPSPNPSCSHPAGRKRRHRLPSGCKRCLGRWRAQSSQFNSQTQTWCPMKNPSLTEERHSVSWNPVVTDIAGVAKQFGLRERMHCCVSIGALLSLISHCVVFKWVSVSLYKWSFWFYDCPLAVP